MIHALIKIIVIYISSTLFLSAQTIIEDADALNHKLRGIWTGETITPVRKYSSLRGSGSVYLKKYELYKLSNINDIDNNVIQWDLNIKGFFSIYIRLKTLSKVNNKWVKTYRIMHYYPNNTTVGLIKKGYIKIGIGSVNNGQWHTIRRDLIKDLNDYDPSSKLLSIDAFWIRAKGQIDNIETLSYRKYEDGTSPDNWHIYGDNTKAKIKSIYSKYRQKKVIQFTGNGMKTGYALKPFFKINNHKTIQWSMKYNENFTVYIKVMTYNGIRYLCYKNTNHNEISKYNQNYLYIGLGKRTNNGKWQTITRNLNRDIKRFEKNNYLKFIIGFMIRGSGKIDDISLLKSMKPKDDPIYSHKHYSINVSALSFEGDDFYVTRLAGRHTVEYNEEEAIILNYKKSTWKNWDDKILVHAQKGVSLGSPNISKHPFSSHKIILRYNKKDIYNDIIYALPKLEIIDTKKREIIQTIFLKGIPPHLASSGNTLFTPTNRILIATYGKNDVKIYRSIESFDDSILEYNMEEIAHFQEDNNIFLEPVLSYIFDKLVIAIRKDIKWFNIRDHQKEIYENINGELRYINDLEGGNLDTIWNKKVLDVEIHGIFMPAYQPNHFLMLASDGGNRQKIITINSNDFSLKNLKYNKKAFSIQYYRGGGYPSYLSNDDELLVFYWEETPDLRRTKIIEKKLR